MNFLLQRPATPAAPRPAAVPEVDGAPEAHEAARRLEAWLGQERARRRVLGQDGRIEAVEEPGGRECRYVYDERGELVGIVEADGSRLTYDYDDRRRLVRAGHPDGTATRYTYDDDRLVKIDDRGVRRRFSYDAAGRLTGVRHGDAGAVLYRYDAAGRVVEARTALVSTVQTFDADGRVVATRQTLGGVTLEARSEFDESGRLARLYLPGGDCPVRYEWDARGRPALVALGERVIARFEYEDERRVAHLRCANGVLETTEADPVDRRPVRRRVLRDDRTLLEREYVYSPAGQVVDDGDRSYEYDPLGRLVAAEDRREGGRWRYRYDGRDNRTGAEDAAGATSFAYDGAGRLVRVDGAARQPAEVAYDRFGRPVRRTTPAGQWTYRYDDAGRLLQARYRGETVARFTYDHKGRLVLAERAGRVERYLYGPDDALLAIADAAGRPLRLVLRTPLGMLAEVHGAVGAGPLYYLHHDDRATCHLVTDEAGEVVARFRYCPFGVPETTGVAGPSDAADRFRPLFGGRAWYPELGLYYFGARWYDPGWGRFLTPDPYTAAPDDERLVHPLWPGARQAAARAELLGAWLKRPRLRNRYAYCGNDPLNRADPTGHWSFGGVLLMLLGAIWTLPNTLFGLLIEITCLVGEVVRWLVWLVSFGHVSWETPGFDVAASGRLNAFALVFSGGWLGSFPDLLGITFGNVFFVYKKWDQHPHSSGPGVVFPAAYNGQVSIPKNEALYEHELRHTRQYGWFGPFFHLGLPIFGVYEWDVILSGYTNAWLERDARDYGGI